MRTWSHGGSPLVRLAFLLMVFGVTVIAAGCGGGGGGGSATSNPNPNPNPGITTRAGTYTSGIALNGQNGTVTLVVTANNTATVNVTINGASTGDIAVTGSSTGGFTANGSYTANGTSNPVTVTGTLPTATVSSPTLTVTGSGTPVQVTVNNTLATISGFVRARVDNSAIPNATVTVVGTNLQALTGTDGSFTISSVPLTATAVTVAAPSTTGYQMIVRYQGQDIDLTLCNLAIGSTLTAGTPVTLADVQFYGTASTTGNTPPAPPTTTGCPAGVSVLK